MIDRTLGPYRVLDKLGQGGMGEVYLAEDSRLGRRVALKLLRADLTEDPARVRRFIQEAKATSALNHPCILTIYDVGETDGTHYIAAEFIEGRTLRAVIAGREDIPLRTTLDIAIQVSEALAAAHAAGIVHRDIKPENVMVRPDGYAKVLDFGLAKLMEQARPEVSTVTVSRPGTILGTVAYMSPEQARGLETDARTDIWSFGVLLYELLTRRQPFFGDTPTDTIVAIVGQDPPSLERLAPEVPGAVARIVAASLRKHPADRYQQMADLCADLRRVRNQLEFDERERGLAPDVRAAIDERQPIASAALTSSGPTVLASPGPATPNNLSGDLSPLIGRASELADITELLQQAETRLLTLTGVGGSGKTRLAHAIARAALERFTDGVYFVDLAAIDDPGLLEQTVAQTIGVKEASEESLGESLTAFLQNRHLLLVLDNFEQIAAAAPKLGDWLAACAHLKILVTSRVRLYLTFEHEFTLFPLAVPTGGGLTMAEVSEYPAVRLFVDRACRAKPDFRLTDETAEPVAEICRALDGLPLAIELAAARVKLLAPRAIRKRLGNQLGLLTGGEQDLPARQRTMRATIGWSYDLLEAPEQALLQRASVFRGGFPLDAVEAVAGDGGGERFDLLDGLSSLVDKGLLGQREQADGDPRFRMLEVVREFAREKLAESGEEDRVRERHAAFFAELSAQAENGFTGRDAAEWFERTELELDNVRAALDWTLQHAPETALRIAGALPMFWIRRGYLREGDGWTKRALEAAGEAADERLLAKALCAMGSLSWNQGNLDAAVPRFEKSLELSRRVGDKRLIVRALDGLGIARIMRKELDAAQALHEEGYALARTIDDRYEMARLANCLGEQARMLDDYTTARRYYEEAIAIARRESYKHVVQLVSINLGAVACRQGDYQAARAFTHETLGIARALGDRIGMGNALERFAALSVVAGRMETAARLAGALSAAYEAVGYEIEDVDQAFLEHYLDQARASLGEAAFERAREEGRAMPLDDAVSLALETIPMSAAMPRK